VADLLAKFVTVRVIQGNGMDLALFQFDYDQTWAAFFLNADRTIYGRYGRRSQKSVTHDISLEGFRKAMAAALELHKGYPGNKESLVGRLGPAPRFRTPEEYPLLKGKKYPATLQPNKTVRQSCIHCHQVQMAERQLARTARKPIPDEALWLYPDPDTLGLVFDPQGRATLKEVPAGSPAHKDGFRAGDEVVRLAGQPLTSPADGQWILHRAGDADRLKAEVRRGGKTAELNLSLPPGWRRKANLSWRESTWDLRRMAAGGMICEDAPAALRKRLGLGEEVLALRVKGLGGFGQHATAKKIGFQKDDVILEFDGRAGRMTESELLAYGVQRKLLGDRVPVTVLRKGERVKLTLPMQ
jgi:hypothetical protein